MNLIQEDADTLKLFFEQFHGPPAITLEGQGEDAYLSIDNGLLTIAPAQVERKSIRGNILVDGYVLETIDAIHNYPFAPDDVAVVEIAREQALIEIFAKAATTYAQFNTLIVQERLVNDAYAEELENQRG